MAEGLRRREDDGAVVRISGGVDGFDGDEDGVGRGGGRSHGDGFGDQGPANAARFQGLNGFVLSGIWEGKDAECEVAGHESAGLGEEHVAEGTAESADAGEGSDADGYGYDYKEETGAGGADFAPGDADGGGPGELGRGWHWG